MNQGKIAVRYNKALFELAAEKDILDEVYKNILILQSILEMNEVKQLLTNPVVKPGKKCEIILGLLTAMDIHPVVVSTVNIMIQNKRELFLESMIRLFIMEYKLSKNIHTANLITAKTMDSHLHDRIKELLQKKFSTEIELKEIVNEKLIGGFILQIDGMQLDASVAASLNKIKKKLLNTPLN
ncbi:MAG: ATP synthase F1 subunit delta [Bacteroidales bacterium]